MRRGGASVVAQVVARVAASPDRAADGPRPAGRPFGPTHYLTLDGRTDADVASRYRLERRRRPGGPVHRMDGARENTPRYHSGLPNLS